VNSPNIENQVDFIPIHSFWNRLHEIRSLRFVASSQKGNTGWSGEGTGDVRVEILDSRVILCYEQGLWKSAADKEFAFRNLYRWTLDESSGSISLEHLRFGIDHPVFLFELRMKSAVTLESFSPHVCRDDRYTATLSLRPDSLDLAWTVKGPDKDEEIRYVYR